MALSQFEIMKINQYLQDYPVDSYEELIPEGKSVSLDDLLEAFLKFFNKAMESKRKEVFILNTLVGISTCVDELTESDYGVEERFIADILEIKNKYLEYAKKNNINNEAINAVVDRIDSFVFITDQDEEEEEPVEEETEEEKRKNMADSIAASFMSLNQENEGLKEEVSQLKRNLSASNKDLKNIQRRFDEAERRVKGLKDEKRAAEKKATSLENSLKQEKQIVEKKTRQLENSEAEIKDYKSKLKELEKLRAEVEEYKKRERGLKTLNKSNNTDVLRKKVKRAMISLLMEKTISFDDLEVELAKKELLVDRIDLFTIFREINQEYDVKVNTDSKKGIPRYSIETPIQKSYVTTSIKRPITDILLTSDWHAYDLDETRLFNRIELLLEYCIRYGISTTVNLGDFYDYRINSSLTRAQNSIDAKGRLESLLQKIPYKKGITHYVMGANHDEILRRYRLDALKIIENMRPDYISLGYHHAILDINGIPFGLHHPDSKYDKLKDYKNGLRSFSKTDVFNAEDMYMNLFGHFHEYRYFPFEGILSCPSLVRDFRQDGAVHLRINYELDGHIANVEIIPLNINNSIKRCKAQVYQKKLTPNSNK